MVARLEKENAQVDEDLLFRYHGELYRARSFWPILFEGLRAPEYTLRDALNVKPAADRVNRAMNYNVEPGFLQGGIEDVDVPVFFFLGRHDYNAPSRLAAEYLQRLRAPYKRVVWFEQSAHFPFYEEKQKFVAEMLRVDEIVRNLTAHERTHEMY